MTTVSIHTRRQKTELNEMWCWVSEQIGQEKGRVLYSKVYFCSAGSRTWFVWLVCDFKCPYSSQFPTLCLSYSWVARRISLTTTTYFYLSYENWLKIWRNDDAVASTIDVQLKKWCSVTGMIVWPCELRFVFHNSYFIVSTSFSASQF